MGSAELRVSCHARQADTFVSDAEIMKVFRN